jgi:hypothetical protein
MFVKYKSLFSTFPFVLLLLKMAVFSLAPTPPPALFLVTPKKMREKSYFVFNEQIVIILFIYLYPVFIFSSFLALIGMILGLVLGNLDNWSSWIFCATAGIFLYVALVDMIPELNSGHAHPSVSAAAEGESEAEGHSHSHGGHAQLLEIGLQVAGMSLGVVIMMLIALYEDNFRDSFSG